MRHHFWVQHASIQHRSCGNSATAASAPTQLSVTQHLPAAKHDAAVQSCCRASPMLRKPQLPLTQTQIRHHFWAQRASIQPRSSGNSAAAAPAPTLLSVTQHLPASSTMIHRQVPAKCPIRCKRPMYPRNRCATISGRNVRRYSLAQAVIQRPRHQHSRCSLRHSNGLHPSTMPQRKAAA